MEEREARRRLGVGDGASRSKIWQAYHRLAKVADTRSSAGRELLSSVSQARDILLNAQASRDGWDWLERLGSGRGAAVIGLVGLGATGISLLANVHIARWSGIAPFLFVVGALFAGRRRKLGICVLMAIAAIVASVLAIRVYADPGTTFFYYDGSQFGGGSNSVFASQSAIPLTGDPKHGEIDTEIYPDPSDAGTLGVMCTRNGVFKHARVTWVYISRGRFETLWIPIAYLYGMAPGEANTLLPCSSWRWLLEKFGEL